MIQTSFNQSVYDTVTIDSGCKLTYRYNVMTTTFPKTTETSTTMSADDCAAARGWTTNERFLQILRTGDNCPYGDGNPGDVFDLTLTDEGRVARKTYLCPEPTVEAYAAACARSWRGCSRSEGFPRSPEPARSIGAGVAARITGGAGARPEPAVAHGRRCAADAFDPGTAACERTRWPRG
jgi:hypothetical protein